VKKQNPNKERIFTALVVLQSMLNHNKLKSSATKLI